MLAKMAKYAPTLAGLLEKAVRDGYHRVAIHWNAWLWPAGLRAEIDGFAH
jgi:hypothetical protein